MLFHLQKQKDLKTLPYLAWQGFLTAANNNVTGELLSIVSPDVK